VFDLEVQMGTSVQMIRKHYAHIKTRQIAGRLAGNDYSETDRKRNNADKETVD
jgi:hypothetical protein